MPTGLNMGLLQQNIQAAMDASQAPGGTSATMAAQLASAIHSYVSQAIVMGDVQVGPVSVVTPNTLTGTGAGTGKIIPVTSQLK